MNAPRPRPEVRPVPHSANLGEMDTAATLIEELDGLEAVAAAWDELADAAGRPSCSAAWLIAWARQHAEPGMLRVVVVREGGEVTGIFPGLLTRGHGGAHRLGLLGTGTASGIEPLARSGHEAQVARLSAAGIAGRSGPRVDGLTFEGVPGGSPWPALLGRHWPGARPGLLRQERLEPEPLISLPGDGFDAWLQTKSGNFRSQIRRARRALERDGGQVRRTADAAELAQDLPAFVRLHEGRWEGRGGSSVIDAAVEAMLAEACPRLLAQDRLDLWCVDHQGETIGAQLWLRGPAVSTMWLSGSDDSHAAVRPAMLIMAAVVQDAYARGLTTVSLGAGGQDYKRRFSDTESSIGWWSLPLPGPRLPLVLGEVEAGRARKAIGRRLTPERKAQLRTLAARARALRGGSAA